MPYVTPNFHICLLFTLLALFKSHGPFAILFQKPYMLLKLKKIFSCSTSHRLLYWVSTAKHFMVFQVLVWQKNSEQTYFYDNEITKVQPVMIFMNQVLTCFVDIHIYGIENIFRKILWCFSKINIFLSVIWLPYSQLFDILDGTDSLTQF